MARLAATTGVIALAALLGWTSYTVFYGQSQDAFADCRSGNVAGGQIGGPFTLVDETGATVTEADVFTEPALVYFGFASCPDVCPLDNARNSEVAQLLESRGLTLRPVFISVDPGRDTPEVLAEYTANFSESLLGLTGTPEQVKAVADAYKVLYEIPQDMTGNYPVNHTTLTYLVLPGTGFADFFHREASAQEIADRAGCFLTAG